MQVHRSIYIEYQSPSSSSSNHIPQIIIPPFYKLSKQKLEVVGCNGIVTPDGRNR